MSQYGAFTSVFCPVQRVFGRQWLSDNFRVLALGFPGNALNFDMLEENAIFLSGRFISAAQIKRMLLQCSCQPEDASVMADEMHAEMVRIEQQIPMLAQAVPGALPVPGVPVGAGGQGSGGMSLTRPNVAAIRLDPPVWQPERSLRANLDEWDRFQVVVGMHAREYAYLLSKKIPEVYRTVIEGMPIGEQSDPALVRAALIANTPDDSLHREKVARRKLDAAQFKTGQSLVGFADELFKLASEIRDNGGEDLLAAQGVKLTRRFVEGLTLELKRSGLATQLVTSGTYVSWTACRLAAHYQEELELDSNSTLGPSYGGNYGGVGRHGRGASPKGGCRGKNRGHSNPRVPDRGEKGHGGQRHRRRRSSSSSSSSSHDSERGPRPSGERSVPFSGKCHYCKQQGH